MGSGAKKALSLQAIVYQSWCQSLIDVIAALHVFSDSIKHPVGRPFRVLGRKTMSNTAHVHVL